MTPEPPFSRYEHLLDLQEFDEAFIDYSGLERHIGFLRQLAIVENSSLFVFDIYKKQYAFFQSDCISTLGITSEEAMKHGQSLFFSLMHPDDVGFVKEAHYRMTEFLLQQPAGERKDYKLIYHFRMLAKNGCYLPFLQQLLPLELDGKGNLWLMLSVHDVLPVLSPDFIPSRRLVHVRTGKLFLFNEDNDDTSRMILSKREVEILGLLAKGMLSRNIADKLFISVNTVNNHRRNILEKTNTGNTTEAIKYAESIGIL